LEPLSQWYADFIKELGLAVMSGHPMRVKAICLSPNQNRQHRCGVLADLLRSNSGAGNVPRPERGAGLERGRATPHVSRASPDAGEEQGTPAPPRSADRHVLRRNFMASSHAGARSPDPFERFEQNPTKTSQHIFAPVTSRRQQNQWVMSRAHVRIVEGGLSYGAEIPSFCLLPRTYRG
jgi:hypothetical protein